jgi:hypothetical protein
MVSRLGICNLDLVDGTGVSGRFGNARRGLLGSSGMCGVSMDGSIAFRLRLFYIILLINCKI